MPYTKKGESKKKFIKRCIPYLWNEEPGTLTAKTKGKKSKQSYAICNSLYKKNHIKEYNEFLDESYNPHLDIVQDCCEKIIEYLREQDFDFYDGLNDFFGQCVYILGDGKISSLKEKTNKIVSYLDDHWGLYDGANEVSKNIFRILDSCYNKTEDSNMEEWVEESIKYEEKYCIPVDDFSQLKVGDIVHVKNDFGTPDCFGRITEKGHIYREKISYICVDYIDKKVPGMYKSIEQECNRWTEDHKEFVKLYIGPDKIEDSNFEEWVEEAFLPKVIKKTTTYILFKPMKADDPKAKYYYTRMSSDETNSVFWGMGYINSLGNVTIVGSPFPEKLQNDLEKEYQESKSEESNFEEWTEEK